MTAKKAPAKKKAAKKDKPLEGELIKLDIKQLQPFSRVELELAKLRDKVDSSHYDYTDSKQNKEARSLVASIRPLKTRVGEIKKELKADAQKYLDDVETEAKTILEAIESCIDVHAIPLQKVEDDEKERIAKIQERLMDLSGLLEYPDGTTSEEWEALLKEAKAFDDTDESLVEFVDEAAKVKVHVVEQLTKNLEKQVQWESDQKELERLRAEKEIADEKEKERKIAEQAKQEAEEKQKQAEQREADAKKRADEAEARAATAREEAKAAEIARQEQEHARKEKERLAREADLENRKKVNNQTLQDLMGCGVSEEQAKAIIAKVVQKKFAHMIILY